MRICIAKLAIRGENWTRMSQSVGTKLTDQRRGMKLPWKKSMDLKIKQTWETSIEVDWTELTASRYQMKSDDGVHRTKLTLSNEIRWRCPSNWALVEWIYFRWNNSCNQNRFREMNYKWNKIIQYLVRYDACSCQQYHNVECSWHGRHAALSALLNSGRSELLQISKFKISNRVTTSGRTGRRSTDSTTEWRGRAS